MTKPAEIKARGTLPRLQFPEQDLRAYREFYCKTCDRGWMSESGVFLHLIGSFHGLTYGEAGEFMEEAFNKASKEEAE